MFDAALVPDPSRLAAANSADVITVPVQMGICIHRAFDPVFSTRGPLEWSEFNGVINELNDVVSAVLPLWKQRLPFVLLFAGFVLFALGGILVTATAGFSGPGPAISVPFLGFFTFVSGMVSMAWLSCLGTEAMSRVRGKLSELNARYAERGIDFALHESRHLELYRRMSSRDHAGFHHHGGVGVRTVTHYTLVVQRLQTGGQGLVPAPDVLASQALSGFRPSAPPPQHLLAASA